MDEDYIRFQVPWYRQTNRTSAAFETALCKRQSGTLQASKRHFVTVETYFRQNQKKQLPPHCKENVGSRKSVI